jgi:hypothetical protein
MINTLIQPTELDINETNINKDVELRIIQYNKSKIKKEIEIYRNKKKIELNDESYKLTKEEKELISIEIINSNDTKQLRDKLYGTIKKEKENYLQLRSDLYGLNQINKTNLQEYILLEKSKLYSYDKLPKFNDLLINSLKFIDLFNSIKNDKKTLIESKKNIDVEVLRLDSNTLKNNINNITENGKTKAQELKNQQEGLKLLGEVLFDDKAYREVIENDKKLSIEKNNINNSVDFLILVL